MEYITDLSQIISVLLIFAQVIEGSTCPKSCMCYEENKTKTVVCAGHIQNGGMNETQLRDIVSDVSNDTMSLHMMGVDVSVLGNNIFDKLSKLRELSIVESHVTTLHQDTFSGLHNLQTLSLSGNKIGALPKGLFRNLTKLEKIDLHMNKITHLEKGVFFNANSVKNVNLNSNGIARIDNNCFHGLLNLETLILRKTSLSKIEEGMLVGLSKLQHLDLSDNDKLEIYPGAFKHLSNLRSLELRKTGLVGDIPLNILSGLVSLTKLDISMNKLDRIPKLGNAQSLEVLILTQNKLKSIPLCSFQGFKNLKEIHLDFCNLLSIHDHAFLGLSNLKILKLDHNRLMSMSPVILGTLKSVSVSLVGNLWSCDCSMYHTKHWIRQSRRNIDIICDSPLELSGRRLQSLPRGVPNWREPVIKDCCHESFLVKQGGNIMVNCSATGVPEPLTNFTQTISGTGNSLQHGVNTLTITDIQTDANFSCVAKNTVGVSRKYFVIKVISKRCDLDSRVIAIIVTLIVISVLTLLVIIYITKFKHRIKHLTPIDKTGTCKDELKLMEDSNGGFDV
jgi:Leucine-rich repeat (LRR) protein